jgi:hypothetical protein
LHPHKVTAALAADDGTGGKNRGALTAADRERHKQLLVSLLRAAVGQMKGSVLVVTSAQLNGAVTRTLKKCTDAKASIGAFKVSGLRVGAH